MVSAPAPYSHRLLYTAYSNGCFLITTEHAVGTDTSCSRRQTCLRRVILHVPVIVAIYVDQRGLRFRPEGVVNSAGSFTPAHTPQSFAWRHTNSFCAHGG